MSYPDTQRLLLMCVNASALVRDPWSIFLSSSVCPLQTLMGRPIHIEVAEAKPDRRGEPASTPLLATARMPQVQPLPDVALAATHFATCRFLSLDHAQRAL